MSDTAAGAPTERTPDFIPGWFKRVHPGTQRPAAPTLQEAVRILDDDAGVFPIEFLRQGETVAPAQPGRRGVVIGLRDGNGMSLAVPPGYWIVRDDRGVIFNWRDDAFREEFSRRDDITWKPPAQRPADREAIDAMIAEGPPPAREGWQGTRPAEGTRRALIYGALLGREVLTADECLDHADAVEGRLLDSQIAVEAAQIAGGGLRDNPYLPPEYAEKIVDGAKKIVCDGAEEHIVGEIREVDEPGRPDAEIVDSDGHTLGGLEVVIGAQDGVPYVSLADLEHVFANLYEDITDRQARKHRGEASVTGTMEARDGESPTAGQTWPTCSPERRAIDAGIPTRPFDREADEASKLAAKRRKEAELAEEQRVDNEDDRPLWKVELDYAANHVRNAVASWMGL